MDESDSRPIVYISPILLGTQITAEFTGIFGLGRRGYATVPEGCDFYNPDHNPTRYRGVDRRSSPQFVYRWFRHVSLPRLANQSQQSRSDCSEIRCINTTASPRHASLQLQRYYVRCG